MRRSQTISTGIRHLPIPSAVILRSAQAPAKAALPNCCRVFMPRREPDKTILALPVTHRMLPPDWP